MSFYLIIDGSGLPNSVAVLNLETREIIASRYSSLASDELPLIVNEVLAGVGLKLNDLKGLGINAGPGSYTGLRISAAFAKGVCTGLSVPLFPLSGLKAMTSEFLKKHQSFAYPVIAMIDARRDEVYASAYHPDNLILEEGPYHVDTDFLSFFKSYPSIGLVGNGVEKALKLFAGHQLVVEAGISASAISLSEECMEKIFCNQKAAIDEFEPNYLKPFYFHGS
ncbi:MAG: hypothetical protein RLZZ46_1188 [Bacteroidota bacterium]|jgi:tRNA threonylcarbamoyladenosine biosynthesis protein TsaB